MEKIEQPCLKQGAHILCDHSPFFTYFFRQRVLTTHDIFFLLAWITPKFEMQFGMLSNTRCTPAKRQNDQTPRPTKTCYLLNQIPLNSTQHLSNFVHTSTYLILLFILVYLDSAWSNIHVGATLLLLQLRKNIIACIMPIRWGGRWHFYSLSDPFPCQHYPYT